MGFVLAQKDNNNNNIYLDEFTLFLQNVYKIYVYTKIFLRNKCSTNRYRYGIFIDTERSIDPISLKCILNFSYWSYRSNFLSIQFNILNNFSAYYYNNFLIHLESNTISE